MTSKISTTTLQGGGGARLNLLQAGKEGAPAVLFLHGFSSSAWCWKYQLQSDLATDYALGALDLRGHGASDKPAEAAFYADGRWWADDVQAAIDALGASQTFLVAWSYGGLVACDYLRRHGTSKLAGLVLVGALSKLGNEHAMSLLGPQVLSHVPGLFATDVATSVATLGNFIRDCHARPLEALEFHEQLGFNCIVPPEVRAALFSRSLDNDDVLATTRVPAMLVHGWADAILLPQASHHVKSLVPHAQLVEIAGVGHSAFREAPDAFNRELRAFMKSALA